MKEWAMAKFDVGMSNERRERECSEEAGRWSDRA